MTETNARLGRAELPDEPETGQQTHTHLWPEDTGTLRAPSRRALVQLLRGPYLSAERHPVVWAALLNDETEIRKRLADMFLELIVDTEAEVAFVRNAQHENLDAPKVVRTMPLTFMDTAMLLHLRQQLLQSGSGERIIVGQDEVTDQLSVYRGQENTDSAGFAKRINASWTKLVTHGVLARTTTEGRFEISPVLRLIFGADQIAAVRTEYARLASASDGSKDADDPIDPDGVPSADLFSADLSVDEDS